MASAIDLLGLGCIAIDECRLVEDYPSEDAKRLVLARRSGVGGTTAGALAAAAAYGASCGIAGKLDQSLAARAIEELARIGVDTTLVQHATGIKPIHSFVIVSRRTSSRTVLFDLHGAAAVSSDWPPEESIASAKLLLIDHFGMEGMLRAAKIARAAGVAVVADFEAHERPEFPELLGLVDHLFLSQSLAATITGQSDPAAACGALWSPQRKVVVVTGGSAGCWCLSSEGRVNHVRAFAVQAIDTTGCGDTFRGVYSAALVAGLPLRERILHAAAAAAILASRPFEESAARYPARAAVEAFLAQHARPV